MLKAIILLNLLLFGSAMNVTASTSLAAECNVYFDNQEISPVLSLKLESIFKKKNYTISHNMIGSKLIILNILDECLLEQRRNENDVLPSCLNKRVKVSYNVLDAHSTVSKRGVYIGTSFSIRGAPSLEIAFSSIGSQIEPCHSEVLSFY